MPIYEYRCTSCQDEFETIQKMSDPPLRKCKKCSGRLEKQLSRAAFQLKGDGWFASGYSKTSAGSGSQTESKSSPSPDAKTTSEPKPKKDSAKSGSDSGSGTKGKPAAASA